jgi:hypothetical protein
MRCAHAKPETPDVKIAWVRLAQVAEFGRPDGSKIRARWFAFCETCFNQGPEKWASLLRADFVWTEEQQRRAYVPEKN